MKRARGNILIRLRKSIKVQTTLLSTLTYWSVLDSLHFEFSGHFLSRNGSRKVLFVSHDQESGGLELLLLEDVRKVVLALQHLVMVTAVDHQDDHVGSSIIMLPHGTLEIFEKKLLTLKFRYVL